MCSSLPSRILQRKTTDFDPSHFVNRLRPSGYGFFLCNSLGTSRSVARAEEAERSPLFTCKFCGPAIGLDARVRAPPKAMSVLLRSGVGKTDHLARTAAVDQVKNKSAPFGSASRPRKRRKRGNRAPDRINHRPIPVRWHIVQPSAPIGRSFSYGCVRERPTLIPTGFRPPVSRPSAAAA